MLGPAKSQFGPSAIRCCRRGRLFEFVEFAAFAVVVFSESDTVTLSESRVPIGGTDALAKPIVDPTSDAEDENTDSLRDLISENTVQAGFECDNGSANELQVDQAYIDRRPLFLYSTNSETTVSDLNVSANDFVTGSRSDVLNVWTSADSEDLLEDFDISYDCNKDGKAIVRLEFTVKFDSFEKRMCVRWAKLCRLGLGGMSVRLMETNENLLMNGEVLTKSTFFNSPLQERYSIFGMKANGLLSLRAPSVISSDTSIVEVNTPGEADDDVVEMSQETFEIEVDYTCLKKGVAKISMMLERGAFSSRLENSREMVWSKECMAADKGIDMVAAVNVFLLSRTYQNKTKTVSEGVTLPGFARPCRRVRLPRGAARRTKPKPRQLQGRQQPPPQTQLVSFSRGLEALHDCVNAVPRLTIPVSDKTTTIEVNGVSLWKKAALKYNTDNLKVLFVDNDPVVAGATTMTTIKLKYICYKESITNLTLTLFPDGYRTVAFAWRKECIGPRMRQSRAITVQQVLVIFSGLVLTAVVLSYLTVRMCTGKMEGEKRSATTSELSSIVGKEGSLADAREVVFND
eukprot:TRINITY_DN73875_c0_g1_i1.p1 TRINITY_DN73875_c0_g1~~TRINITY_DN73875_c0_g1_i1.p1  ORF type:complete len:573 (-),score=96.18 TRINITY_DN73875_c0_g1_i1:59-1777(-)